MNAVIAWLSERRDEVEASLSEKLERRSREFDQPGQHRRAATNAAQRMLGFDWFLRFARGRRPVWSESDITFKVREALKTATAAQSDYQLGGATEADKFITLLRLVFHLKRGHVQSIQGRCPGFEWGWKSRDDWGSTPQPIGPHIGCLNIATADTPTDFYPLPEVIYPLCQQVAATNEHKPTSRRGSCGEPSMTPICLRPLSWPTAAPAPSANKFWPPARGHPTPRRPPP